MTVTLGWWVIPLLLSLAILTVGEHDRQFAMDIFLLRLPLTLIVWLLWAVLT